VLDHGNAIAIYFLDPQGNKLEVVRGGHICSSLQNSV